MSLGLLALSGHVTAATLLSEDFQGYTSFPSQVPALDHVNTGIPKLSEGANEIWYAGRFGKPSNGTIDSDLAVQKIGGGTNPTHTGRVEDKAGLLFHINTEGYENVKLSFNYRTFKATSSADRIVAGFFTGDLNFGTCSGNGEAGCYRDFYASDFGSSATQTKNWWNSQWTEVVSDRGNTWKSISDVVLPGNTPSVWVAFWMKGSEGHYGKFDNVKVTADLTPVPLPSALYLFGAGILGLTGVMRRR